LYRGEQNPALLRELPGLYAGTQAEREAPTAAEPMGQALCKPAITSVISFVELQLLTLSTSFQHLWNKPGKTRRNVG
jgi:hypothetical protein